MPSKNIVIKDLAALYDLMGLPHEEIDTTSGFTTHYLQDIFKTLPVSSIPYRPDFFSFLFVKQGVGRYTIDDQHFDITPGTVYFTNPGNYRDFEWREVTDACLIVFTESFLKEQVHADVYREFSFLLTEIVEPRILRPEQFAVMEELYRFLRREHRGGSPYKLKIIGSTLVALLLKIKEYFFQDYNPIYEGNRSSQIVKTFRRNLEQHVRELVSGKADTQLRVQDYAEKQSLNANYLSSVIRSKTGKTIVAWIADKLVAEAKVMLQDPDLSIKEIASRLGFLETSHFSNYFRKHAQQSPLEYRKSL
ncbi:AraC family transcriptional regulator [uncultured Chitinophaga sp.]|jgi:AraC-type DNA-binding domain-containing proteins|uniref:AraC family transcriptional regulator n=1 Tax=uncultured Chitinophaga sp. TaxID=339340 RepID=UPI00262A886C|nr:AraC family transcriptional regulator [uncultured Chitinophaga sp.]